MEKLMTSQEVCDHYRICRMTLYHWVKQGFPVIKTGRRNKFCKKDIDEYLKNKNVKLENI